MLFSNATEYAIRGLAELAGRSNGANLLLDQLVAGTDLPRDFLAKIFQKLVRAGILTSAKGRGGGFALARPGEQITLQQIIQAIEGTDALERCAVGLNQCNEQMICPIHDLYQPMRLQLRQYLQDTTIAGLAGSLSVKQALHQPHERSGDADPARPDERNA